MESLITGKIRKLLDAARRGEMTPAAAKHEIEDLAARYHRDDRIGLIDQHDAKAAGEVLQRIEMNIAVFGCPDPVF